MQSDVPSSSESSSGTPQPHSPGSVLSGSSGQASAPVVPELVVALTVVLVTELVVLVALLEATEVVAELELSVSVVLEATVAVEVAPPALVEATLALLADSVPTVPLPPDAVWPPSMVPTVCMLPYGSF